MDVVSVAGAAVQALAPFLPYLGSFAKSVQTTVQEAITKHGGEVAWKLAQQVWGKLTGALGAEPKLKTAADVVASDPADEDSQKLLVRRLAERLQADAALAEELKELLGGEPRIQQMIAGVEGRLMDVRQVMEGAGHQIMQVGDRGVITGSQEMRR